VTYKMGFGFDDQIYWTFMQTVTTFHKSISSTEYSSSSDHTTLIHYSTTKVTVKVTLRLTAGQSVSQSWCRAPLLFDSFSLVIVGRTL
jgi:hypothetical protein